jgi:phosphate-selective porin
MPAVRRALTGGEISPISEKKEEQVKKRILAAALFVAACAAQGAGAKTLEDVLKEKGVITEADYQEVIKSKQVSYTPGNGKGFTFATPDEKFKLMIGGRIQARYSFFDRDQDSRDASQAQDVSEWRIRRLKFWLGGNAYTKDLTYYVQTDFTQSSNAKFVEYAYLNYRFLDEVQVLAGQTKIPFGRQWLNSSAALQFVDRSPVSDAFRPGYDTGVILNGKIAKGLVNYNLGTVGGDGQSIVRATNDNAFVARVTVNPFGDVPYTEADLDRSEKPLLSVGANYFYDVLQATRTVTGTITGAATATTTLETNNLNFAQPRNGATLVSGGWLNRGLNSFTKTEKLNIHTYGVDAALKWRGAYALGEYLIGQAEGNASGKLLRAHGFYAQAGYCVIPKTLEAAVRYSWLDPNRDAANDQFTEVAGAVSYYFNKHNLKLQADVADIHDQARNGADEMQYRMQAQIVF